MFFSQNLSTLKLPTATRSFMQTTNAKPAAVPFCPKAMVTKIQEIESKFSDKYKPRCVQGITFLANVPTPAIDFSKIKPHLHKNLPKPELYPPHGCSEDPSFYMKYTEPNHSGGKTTKYQAKNPFGATPGFLTNLGILPVPSTPIGGYIYAGGTGTNTRYCLFAEPVFHPAN